MANTCKKCAADVKSNQSSVGCELCGAWYHAKCVGITSDTYKYLKASDGSGDHSNGGMMWFCMDCLGQASKITKNISDFRNARMTECELTKTNSRLNSLELEIKENK